MPKAKDLVGWRFGRLVALSRNGTGPGGNATWICQCACGNRPTVSTGDWGKVQSCGCLARELAAKRLTTHGMANTPTYNARRNMIQRCTNPNYHRYADHGGRGISICDRWLESFENFLADMGEKPPSLTLERIDNNGNYEPGNCRWATASEQASNKRNNKFVTRNGITKTVAAWCQELSIPHSVVQRRELRGWPEERWFDPARSWPRADAGKTRKRHSLIV